MTRCHPLTESPVGVSQGRSQLFLEGGAPISGAKRQMECFVARVRWREAPPIEQRQGSGGAAPGGGLGAKSPMGG